MRPVGRILPGRSTGRQRRAGMAFPAEPNRLLRLVQSRGSFRDLRANLAQRRNVVENPERPAMCSDDEIVSVNGEIAHRGMWQIELQRLPVVTIIKGNEYRALRTCKEQPLAFGIFAIRLSLST